MKYTLQWRIISINRSINLAMDYFDNRTMNFNWLISGPTFNFEATLHISITLSQEVWFLPHGAKRNRPSVRDVVGLWSRRTEIFETN